MTQFLEGCTPPFINIRGKGGGGSDYDALCMQFFLCVYFLKKNLAIALRKRIRLSNDNQKKKKKIVKLFVNMFPKFAEEKNVYWNFDALQEVKQMNMNNKKDTMNYR